MAIEMKAVCPRCFSEISHSNVMAFQNGVFICPKNPTHKFSVDENGFFIPYKL